MAVTATPAVTGHRPAAVWITIGVLTFLGVSAVAGGIAMVFGIGTAPPHEWLDRIPLIDNWVIPGLILGIGFGVGSLLAAYGILRRPRWTFLRPIERPTRHHWAWAATILLGLGHIAWIAIELTYIPRSGLQAIYGGVGVALLLLPLHHAVRAYLAIDAGPQTKC